jgi:hypothetical protein
MNLSDYLDTDKLANYLKLGLVMRNKHPDLPLSLYCYGRRAVYDNIWDSVTKKCRGLIVENDTDKIIARPFEKFFAYETEGQEETYGRNVESIEKLYGPPTITEKINGNLGIFWNYKGEWGIASKGSFSSVHAKWAKEWFQGNLSYGIINRPSNFVWPIGYTPIFEMICQDIQPHCITYPADGLVLLALINKETGEELNYKDMLDYALLNGISVTARYCIPLKDAIEIDRPGHEGYVATYAIPVHAPLKLKIKHPSFLTTRKKFYEDIELAKLNLPVIDDMYEAVRKHSAELVKRALVEFTLRKEFAEFFNLPENKVYAPVCFAMMDTGISGKHQDAIWRVVGNLRGK